MKIQSCIKKCSIFLTIGALLCAKESIKDPEWCGNKHKNLVILRDILKGSADAEVPPFLGIGTGRVEKFLAETNPSIFPAYREVARRLNKTHSHVQFFRRAFSFMKGLFKSPKTDPYTHWSTEDLLQGIKSSILNAFKFYPFTFTQNELNFFNETANDNGFLMVRSTGVEDNPNVANAGGNLSVPYVKPEIRSIKAAMGEVVASYFGMQSLKNRIAGGEVLSADDHTLPVLIQRLIGEPIGGASEPDDIPVSGVSYTTNASLSDKNFSIAEVDASYGHGEGVVANKITTDRYFLTPSRVNPQALSIYPLLYEKNVRLIPTEQRGVGIVLSAIKNKPNLAHKSSLSQEQLKQLYTVLKLIEESYHEPTDIEFIVMRKKIYIVQARPAMRKAASPSYFESSALTSANISNLLNAVVLVPGTGALQVITDPNDIIVTKTLDEADQMPNSFSCKAVAVHTWASSLSHAAVNFMSHGTPCLYVDTIEGLKKELQTISPSRPLIIDTQRRLIFLWKNSSLHPEKFIVQGWLEHPIERALSLFIDPAPVLNPISILPKDPKLINLMLQLKVSSDPVEQQKLLTTIHELAEKLISLTERRITTTKYTLSPQEQMAFTVFKQTYRDLMAEFTKVIEQKVEHFEFLFYHKMLEALLYQVPGNQRLLAGYTYSYFLNDIFAKQYIQRIYKKGTISHAQELGYATLCPTKELSQKWTDFIIILDRVLPTESMAFKENVLTFELLLKDLNESDNLSLWLASSFYQATYDQTLDEELVKKFIITCAEEYTQPMQQFLQKLTACRKDILAFQSQKTSPLTRVQEAQSLWTSMQQKLIEPLTNENFITNLTTAPLPLQMAAYTTMDQAVDVLDGTIKRVKASAQIPLKERIDLFKTMLNDFYKVSESWALKVMPREALHYNPAWPLAHYLDQLKYLYDMILAQSTNDSMFKRSANFSVEAAMLGSGTAFERHYPQSAEDVFMLIHQNTLAVIAASINQLFSSKPLAQSMYIPPFLEYCRNSIQSQQGVAIQPIGISYSSHEIKLSYNIPLNNHSATLQLTANTITGETLCSVQFLGEARGRWEVIAIVADLSPQLSGLKLAQDVYFSESAGIVSWSWILEKEAELPILIDYLGVCHTLSFENPLSQNDLCMLYRGSGTCNEAVKKIVENYKNKFGSKELNWPT